MKKILSAAMLLINTNLFAQDDSIKVATTINTPANPFSVSGYAEVYYCYDFNKPVDNNRPAFFYSHNRHNEFNLNLGFLKGSYAADKVRANLSLATGSYMNANYAAEPATFKNIFEANAGIKIGRKNLWLDAGIFSSHIGFESAVAKDCWTLTRSILADNTPYFESGAKLTYTSNNNKWLLSGLLLNGWQRVKRVDGNSLMSFGTQIQFRPNETTTFNYSTFIGTDKPDSARTMRYFHNLYGIFNITKKFGFIVGFDVGTEQQSKKSNAMNEWYSPVIILKYSTGSKLVFAAKGEYYSDKNGVIILTATPNGFQTTGFSVNVDYAVISNAVIRVEARTLNSKDAVFSKGPGLSNNNTFITSSIAVSF